METSSDLLDTVRNGWAAAGHTEETLGTVDRFIAALRDYVRDRQLCGVGGGDVGGVQLTFASPDEPPKTLFGGGPVATTTTSGIPTFGTASGGYLGAAYPGSRYPTFSATTPPKTT